MDGSLRGWLGGWTLGTPTLGTPMLGTPMLGTRMLGTRMPLPETELSPGWVVRPRRMFRSSSPPDSL